VTVKNIRRRHFSRNPHIVGVLKTWRYMEELGFGVDRVFREMEAAGAPPPLITDDGGVVTVTLYAFKPISPTNAAWLGLNERQARVLAILAERGRITNREYRELFSVSNATAYADLTELVEKGLIKRAGVGRGAFYRLAPSGSADQMEQFNANLMQT
jgi:ATP-dependent DNA helicase RecG